MFKERVILDIVRHIIDQSFDVLVKLFWDELKMWHPFSMDVWNRSFEGRLWSLRYGVKRRYILVASRLGQKEGRENHSAECKFHF